MFHINGMTKSIIKKRDKREKKEAGRGTEWSKFPDLILANIYARAENKSTLVLYCDR